MNKTIMNENHTAESTADKNSDNDPAIVVETPVEKTADQPPREVNGPRGLEPTRYGDWEANGRCYDF